MTDTVTFDYDGYGENIGWLDPETQAALLDAKTAEDDPVKPRKRDRVRRLVVLRGSHTSEISGPPIMETR
jgi:hypothetical protein